MLSKVGDITQAVPADGLVWRVSCPTNRFIQPMQTLRSYDKDANRIGVMFEYGVECVCFKFDELECIAALSSSGSDAAGSVVNAPAPDQLLAESSWIGPPTHLTQMRYGHHVL